MRTIRPAVLAALLALAACAHTGTSLRKRDEPATIDFVTTPDRYLGQTVRLERLSASRVDVTRPIVFLIPDLPGKQIVVFDGRSLASKEHLQVGDLVTIEISCNEGKTDQGNILLAIDKAPEPSGAH